MLKTFKTYTALVFASLLFSQAVSAGPLHIKKPRILTEDFWLSFAEKHQNITQNTLAVAMNPRCIAAAPAYVGPIQAALDCQKAIWYLFVQLDATSITQNLTGTPRSFTVAFKKEMMNVLNEVSTTHFLNSLFQERDLQMLMDHSTVSIAQVAQRVFRSKTEVIRVMATLFQNTSTVMAHINWLEIQKNKMSRLQLQNLALVKQFYSQMAMDKIDQRVSYKYLAPDMMRTGLTAYDSYHFYVSAFLFLQTRKIVKGKDWAIWLSAYFFNYVYELMTSSKTRMNYLVDPKVLQNTWSIKDIYAGYYAVAYLLEPRVKPMSLSEFQRLALKNNRDLERNFLKITLSRK